MLPWRSRLKRVHWMEILRESRVGSNLEFLPGFFLNLFSFFAFFPLFFCLLKKAYLSIKPPNIASQIRWFNAGFDLDQFCLLSEKSWNKEPVNLNRILTQKTYRNRQLANNGVLNNHAAGKLLLWDR